MGEYMNKLDRNFYEFVNTIKNLSFDELFNKIKTNYKNIHPKTQENIASFLNTFKFWGTLNPDEEDYQALLNQSKVLYEHMDDIVWLYEKLCDYHSKTVLYAIVNNWVNYDFKTLGTVMDYKYLNYFDLDLLICFNDATLVDIGCYTGDTVLDYINTYGENSYKKIYCYDITPESLEKAKNNLSKYKNIEFREKAVLDEVNTVFLDEHEHSSSNRLNDSGTIELETTTIDEDIKDEVSIIKMDIEGSEYKALEGSKRHITLESPVLLISIYHGYDDIWKIPKLIYSYNKNYEFYIRYYGGPVFPTEITLIAKPKTKADK